MERKVLRVMPTPPHYSDIVSDVPSESIHGIHILTFYLTFFLAYALTFYPDLSGIYSDILAGISSDILSDLSDIGSGIFSRINSGIASGILSGMWVLLRAPQHPELQIDLIDPHLGNKNLRQFEHPTCGW